MNKLEEILINIASLIVPISSIIEEDNDDTINTLKEIVHNKKLYTFYKALIKDEEPELEEVYKLAKQIDKHSNLELYKTIKEFLRIEGLHVITIYKLEKHLEGIYERLKYEQEHKNSTKDNQYIKA